METLLSPTVLLIPSLWWGISEAGAGVPPGSLGQKVLALDSPWERLAPLEHRQGQDPLGQTFCTLCLDLHLRIQGSWS